MATPRVFFSSTCYDLQEVRNNLRSFVQEFGLEPVMSEFGDIFYEYSQHVQDAAISEIEKCNLFVLIVGNNYGTIYHKEHPSTGIPDSVTLREFKKALSIDIPKHIFINRFVQYDYINFQKVLREELNKHFTEHDVEKEEIQKAVSQIRATLDASYHFPQPSYRFVFHFLDLIDELKVNNAIFPFEHFSDIRDLLRKQWAGLIYERLTTNQSVNSRFSDQILAKLENVEKILSEFLATKTEAHGQISIDIDKILGSIANTQLSQVQEILQEIIDELLTNPSGQQMGSIVGPVDSLHMVKWLGSLEGLLKTYKWSKSIPFEEVFRSLTGHAQYWPNRSRELSYDTLMKLFNLFKSIPSNEQTSFASTIILKLKPIILEKVEPAASAAEDDRPF